MVDGLGLVYEKQGNTGAAAYNAPAFEIGKNPLDVLAFQAAEQNQQLAKEKSAREKAKQEKNLKALEFDIKGWDEDQMRIFAQKTIDLKKKGAELALMGKDLNDYTDKDVVDWISEVNKTQDAAGSSKKQEAEYYNIRDIAAAKPGEYDYEGTMKALNDYMKMDPVARMDINPTNLLVRKYSALDPTKDLNMSSFVGQRGYSGEKSSTSYTKLDEKKLKAAIRTKVESGDYDANYEYNKSKFGWKSKEDYIDYLFKDKKNYFTKDSQFTLHALPSTNTSGMTPEQASQAVEETKPTVITVASISKTGQTREKNGKILTDEYNMYYPQGITGIDIVVPGGDIVDVTNNQRGVKNKVTGERDFANNYNYKSGNLAVVLVNKYGQIYNDDDAEKYSWTFVDASGKDVEKSFKQAIIDGDLKYDVILQGNAKVSGGGDDSDLYPSYVLAEKVITSNVTSKSDDMNDALAKTKILKGLAEKKNNRIKYDY